MHTPLMPLYSDTLSSKPYFLMSHDRTQALLKSTLAPVYDTSHSKGLYSHFFIQYGIQYDNMLVTYQFRKFYLKKDNISPNCGSYHSYLRVM